MTPRIEELPAAQAVPPTHACPACGADTPARAVFCVECHFHLPRGYWSKVVAVAFQARRESDDARRRHLEEQLAGYVSVCVRWLKEHGHA